MGIDYLGLIKAEGKSIFDKVSAISADIKSMAKDCNVPVIVLCQVNRGYANSKQVEIEMDAAKGGGDIEAGADFMVGLWMQNEILCAKLLKNRNGPSNLRWEIEIDAPTLRFIRTREFTQTSFSKDKKETDQTQQRRKSRWKSISWYFAVQGHSWTKRQKSQSNHGISKKLK